MANKDVPHFEPGKVISAGALEELRRQLQSARISVAAPLEMHTSSTGTTLAYNPQKVELWAKITGGSGANYSWTEQVAGTTAGSWVLGKGSGTTSVNQAIEANGNATVTTNTYVRLKRAGKRWLFTHGTC